MLPMRCVDVRSMGMDSSLRGRFKLTPAPERRNIATCQFRAITDRVTGTRTDDTGLNQYKTVAASYELELVSGADCEFWVGRLS